MKKAVFLDRDGVINEVLSDRVKYVNHPSQFYLLDGVGEAIRLLNEQNFEVFVVTNQGGVGLGFMTEQRLIDIHEKMKRDIATFGGQIRDISYCIHKPKEGCLCRKPGSKMITDLAEKYEIDLTKSFMVGDRDVDILAGKKAGVVTILVGDETVDHADYHFPSLLDAANWLVNNG
ncbi:D-glycero-alpha-D-manno-heptose-1,7-bisphosphate 7-phosphatase [Bacillus kexueae]|uniref:D-glycero-alpha-D-manno-heptose-1,7-bisphosphate 7-phosphatase n=1 Tax=Aeribacillus kexueae TaxID=2078952 RepID=UPI001FAF733A